MGIGDPPIPVDSNVELNNPVPSTGNDGVKKLDNRLTTLERTGNTAELERRLQWLYDNASGGPYPYPPP